MLGREKVRRRNTATDAAATTSFNLSVALFDFSFIFKRAFMFFTHESPVVKNDFLGAACPAVLDQNQNYQY